MQNNDVDDVEEEDGDDEEEDDDSFLDDMYDSEQQSPPIFRDGQRYIGIASPPPSDAETPWSILLNTVQPRTFFRHSGRDVVRYLCQYSLMKTSSRYRQTQILQLIILSDDTYAVCDKTIWLRLVQRRWKCALQNRQKLVRRYLPDMWHPREIGHTKIRHIPQLRGLMCWIPTDGQCSVYKYKN